MKPAGVGAPIRRLNYPQEDLARVIAETDSKPGHWLIAWCNNCLAVIMWKKTRWARPVKASACFDCQNHLTVTTRRRQACRSVIVYELGAPPVHQVYQDTRGLS